MAQNKPKDDGKFYVNPFRSCDDKGKPVMFRFSSPKALRDVYTKAQEDDVVDSGRRARLLGAYEGKVPWDPQKLEAAGFKSMTNINWLGLKGQIDARAGTVSNLALDTTDLVELRAAAVELAGPDAETVGDIVAAEFSDVLRRGLEFLPALATMVRESDLYGFGPLMWTDPIDYKPTALLRANVKLPETAPHLSSRNELIMIEADLPASYAFGLFDNAEQSAELGWNLEALRRFIVATFVSGEDTASQTGDEKGTSVAESAVTLARENRLFETKQFYNLKVIHAFVRETYGERKVSHYMIPAKGTQDEFLLVRHGAYDSMDQCVIWLPYTVTETGARGLRGLASYIAPIEDLKNRRMCGLSDAAESLLKVHLQRQTGSTGERLTITEQGQYVAYPADLQAAVSPLQGANVQQAAAIVELMSRVAGANALGSSGPAAAAAKIFKGADRRTKEEALMDREEGEKSEQALFVLRAVVFDSIFRECFRRFMKIVLTPALLALYPEAQLFVRRCAARGVGKDQLRGIPESFEVYMCRDLVAGGSAAKAGMLRDVLDLGGNLDERGRIAGTHDYVRARMGAKAAERYRPVIGRDAMPSDAASHATLENNDMLELSAALAAPDQMHWSHIPVHGKLVQQIVESVNSGQVQDPQRMLDTLQMVSEHIQAHIQYGGAQIGKEEDAKAALRDLRSLRPITQALTIMASNIDRVRRAEEEKRQRAQETLQAKADGQEAAVKTHEIDVKAGLKKYEIDRMTEVKMAAADSKAQTDTFRARAQAEIARVTAANKQYINAGKATANPPPSTEGLVPPEIF